MIFRISMISNILFGIFVYVSFIVEYMGKFMKNRLLSDFT